MNKYEIGKIFKAKRLSLNIRSTDLCSKLNISRATLSMIENGKGNYSVETFLSILNYLDLDISISNCISNSSRLRASRINTSLEHKKNRFIVMCIEQYIKNSKKSPKIVYSEMKRENIINELKDHYEDLHGMSTEYLNDYIDKALKIKEVK